MFKTFLVLIFSIVTSFISAQTHQFVFIENLYKQPFSIKINGKTQESNGKSFITLPKLAIGNHTIFVSTENSKDNKFTLSIDENDAGYTLKQNENNDWILFDINRFTIVEQDGKKTIIIEPAKPQIIIDIEEKDVIKINDVKEILDTTINTKKDEIALIETPKKIVEKKYKPKTKKIAQHKTEEGIHQTYVDISNNKIDTIAIYIPIQNNVQLDTITALKAKPIEEQKIENSSVDIALLSANNCFIKATEKDVADFSQKLQTASILKAKLKVANIVFKEKCYTTNQIKRLSVLFNNDSGKFNFFKLALPAISDSKNFVILAKEIKDEKLQEELMALTNP